MREVTDPDTGEVYTVESKPHPETGTTEIVIQKTIRGENTATLLDGAERYFAGKRKAKRRKTQPQVKFKEKLSRNAPCVCGSGVKLKHCCMRATLTQRHLFNNGVNPFTHRELFASGTSGDSASASTGDPQTTAADASAEAGTGPSA